MKIHQIRHNRTILKAYANKLSENNTRKIFYLLICEQPITLTIRKKKFKLWK